MEVKIKLLSDKAKIPTRAYEGDACYDLYAAEEVIIPPYSTAVVGTGIAMEPPEGFFIRLYPRSGLSSQGIIVGAGIVDPGYRGEIKVVLHNMSSAERKINIGDKIAQFTLHKVYDIDFIITDNLSESCRGSKGFGSSDK